MWVIKVFIITRKELVGSKLRLGGAYDISSSIHRVKEETNGKGQTKKKLVKPHLDEEEP